jgi:serine/threonine protein phosphatase PrpC
MFKLFLQIVTCNQWPKDREYPAEDFDVVVPQHNDIYKQELNDRHDLDIGPIRDFHIYSSSRMGAGPGKTECQDTYAVHTKLTPSIYFFAVYDGHGIRGKDVSVFVNEQFSNCIRKNANKIERLITKDAITPFFNSAFRAIDNKLQDSRINSSASGTCCNMILISKEKCYIANLGDSRAVLCRTHGQNFETIDLSTDHKPSRADEKKRVLENGGIIEPIYYQGVPVGPDRVWTHERDAGIAMTRAIGDVRGKKAGLISEPEVMEVDLQVGDRFIVMASDGLWDVMTSEEAVKFVVDYEEDGKPKANAAKALVREGQKRWAKLEENEESPYRDDITVIVAYPEFHSQSTMADSPLDSPR